MNFELEDQNLLRAFPKIARLPLAGLQRSNSMNSPLKPKTNHHELQSGLCSARSSFSCLQPSNEHGLRANAVSDRLAIERRTQSLIVDETKQNLFELQFHESEIERTSRLSITSKLSSMIKRVAPSNVLTKSFQLAQRSSLRVDPADVLLRLAEACQFQILANSGQSIVVRKRGPKNFKNSIGGCVFNRLATVYELKYLSEVRELVVLTIQGTKEDLKGFCHSIRTWLCEQALMDCSTEDVQQLVQKRFGGLLTQMNLQVTALKKCVQISSDDLDTMMQHFEKARREINEYLVSVVSPDSLIQVSCNEVVESVLIDKSQIAQLFQKFYQKEEQHYQACRSLIAETLEVSKVMDLLSINPLFRLSNAENLYSETSTKIDQLEYLSSFQEQLEAIDQVIQSIEKTCFDVSQGQIVLDSEDNLFALTVFASIYSTNPYLLTILRIIECYMRARETQANSRFSWLNASIDYVLSWNLG